MSIERPPAEEREVKQAGIESAAGLASAVVAGACILFISPVALLATFTLVPNAVELIDRILHFPVAPRLPLTLMLLIQIALISLLTTTFLSWRRGQKGRDPWYHNSKTVTLGVWALGVGVFAYLWIAVQVAAFPD